MLWIPLSQELLQILMSIPYSCSPTIGSFVFVHRTGSPYVRLMSYLISSYRATAPRAFGNGKTPDNEGRIPYLWEPLLGTSLSATEDSHISPSLDQIWNKMHFLSSGRTRYVLWNNEAILTFEKILHLNLKVAGSIMAEGLDILFEGYNFCCLPSEEK